MARLVSVNIGTPTVQPGSKEATGIVKVPRTGPVLLDAEGILGDAVMDRKHHGGPDQAIYVYLQSDYDWWVAELQRPLDPGTFGENLTIAGVDGNDLSIGDRFAIGEVLLEVTFHRQPCGTFARRMGNPGWVRQFQRAGRPGAYCRVLQPGTVEAGMAVDYRPFAGERVTVAELMRNEGVSPRPAEFMRRVLETPVRLKTREKFTALLANA